MQKIDKDGYLQLEEGFTQHHFIYNQEFVDENREYAIYSQKNKETNKVLSYEVIRVVKREAVEVYGRKYPKQECYPGSSQWGQTGFTTISLKQAYKKIEELKLKKKEKEEKDKLPPPPKYIPTGKKRGRPKSWKKKVVSL